MICKYLLCSRLFSDVVCTKFRVSGNISSQLQGIYFSTGKLQHNRLVYYRMNSSAILVELSGLSKANITHPHTIKTDMPPENESCIHWIFKANRGSDGQGRIIMYSYESSKTVIYLHTKWYVIDVKGYVLHQDVNIQCIGKKQL